MNAPGGMFESRLITVTGATTEVFKAAAPGSGQMSFATMQLAATCAIEIEVSFDQVTWTAVQFKNLADGADLVVTAAAGAYRATIVGFPYVRFNVASGSGVVGLQVSA